MKEVDLDLLEEGLRCSNFAFLPRMLQVDFRKWYKDAFDERIRGNEIPLKWNHYRCAFLYNFLKLKRG